MTDELPRGYRNNNIGNIRHSSTIWVGQKATWDDPDFVTFKDPKFGIRAVMCLLKTYFFKHDLKTIRGMIERYAPSVENNTQSYIDAVSKMSGVGADDVITDLGPLLIPLVKSIAIHENGVPPMTLPAYWYEDSVYEAGKELATAA